MAAPDDISDPRGPSTPDALTLGDVEHAIRTGWSAETCDPVDLPAWSPENSARGQCGVTALVLHDLLGGELLLADVVHADGARQGVHYWNRLVGGLEVDLTREQFTDGEVVGTPRVVTRPPGPPARCRDQYDLLRARVARALRIPLPGTVPAPDTSPAQHGPTSAGG